MAARVQTTIEATPEDVFALLADPSTYVEWEVGSSAIHASDESWPEPGSLFEHSHGKWLVQRRDSTRVLESEPPRRLLLESRLRPLIVAEVEFVLAAAGSGTRVAMTERVTGGLARLWLAPIRDALLAARNRETLRRLRRLAESRS
ncbi:MAG: SRPBCC family protein [Thermoleophilaceae bacterium]